MSTVGSAENPLRVAIVGAGPSGFYATDALFRSGHVVRVDMLERLPVPFGLVRYGVAPDHPKLKEAIQVYDRIARAPEFRFLGNVTVGRDVSVEELRAAYHAVLFACGGAIVLSFQIQHDDIFSAFLENTGTGFLAPACALIRLPRAHRTSCYIQRA